ncbi:MAG: amino acid ABC transporter permease [Solibacillus sp.]
MTIFDVNFAIEQIPEVLKGVPNTIIIAVVAIIFGVLIGIVLAFVRQYKIPVLNQLTILYVSFIRGTPLVVQLYVFYYGLPYVAEMINDMFGTALNSDKFSPLLVAFVAYTINTVAYQTETFRAAITTVPAAQMEAAYSVGLSTRQALLRIIIPQAFVSALPNIANHFVGLIKATSLAFALKVIEIIAISKIVANEGYNYLEMYTVAALIYWGLCIFFEVILTKYEKSLRKYEGVNYA